MLPCQFVNTFVVFLSKFGKSIKDNYVFNAGVLIISVGVILFVFLLQKLDYADKEKNA